LRDRDIVFLIHCVDSCLLSASGPFACGYSGGGRFSDGKPPGARAVRAFVSLELLREISVWRPASWLPAAAANGNVPVLCRVSLQQRAIRGSDRPFGKSVYLRRFSFCSNSLY